MATENISTNTNIIKVVGVIESTESKHLASEPVDFPPKKKLKIFEVADEDQETSNFSDVEESFHKSTKKKLGIKYSSDENSSDDESKNTARNTIIKIQDPNNSISDLDSYNEKENSDEEEPDSDSSDEDEDDDDKYYYNDDEDEDDDDDDYNEESDCEDDDSDYTHRHGKSTKTKRKKSYRKNASKGVKITSSNISCSRYYTRNSYKKEFENQEFYHNNKKQIKRSTTRRINYCEHSDEESAKLSDNEEVYQDNYKSSRKPQNHHHHHQSYLNTINDPLIPHEISINPNGIETIERVLKHRIGKVGATGSKTAIYNVEENDDPNEISPEAETTSELEDQYLIKWLNWSHLHNTWESKESLSDPFKIKGIKKLENFLKKEEELKKWKKDAYSNNSLEDIEYMECQSELFENLIDSYKVVERVIAITRPNTENNSSNSNDLTGADVLCKWQGLPYSECSWEDGELIQRRFPEVIEEYIQRQNNALTLPPINPKTQRVFKYRPRFVALKFQPNYIGHTDPELLQLRDYQLKGLNWLASSWCKQNSVILADEMGLGKTIQVISFLSYLFNEHHLYGPFLVVVPLSTIQGWQRELKKWCPELNVVIYLGDINSRGLIQKYEWFGVSVNNKQQKIRCNLILTTYEILLKDKAFFSNIQWACLIVDEAHRLKNEDSILYRVLINFETNHRLLITGTPLQNSLKELWALLHFIMPDKFNSWDEFDNKYSSVLEDGARFHELHKDLEPYLLRRAKKDVERSLPSKVEQILRVEMTRLQKKYYKLVLTKNYKELCKGVSNRSISSFLNIMMELKKCSNHSFLIRRNDDNKKFGEETKIDPESELEKCLKGSGKLLLLDKLLRRLKETGHRVLIFSQMVRMLDILAEYMRLRRFQFQRLDGSIKGEIRRQALDHFNKPDSEDFCFLLSTRAGGLGINLATADTVIIYDSDWNPQNDLQAQARAHRIGQKNQVNIYRLVTKNSIEEDIVERAKQKMVLDHLVIQRMDTSGRTVLNKNNNSSTPFTKEELNSILKFGAEELFKDENHQLEDKEELQIMNDDIDEILKRAETREENQHMSASEELLSQFKVANFSTIEDDPIIPTSSTGFAASNISGDNFRNESKVEKSWDEIIPESDRHRIEFEEQEEKMKELTSFLYGRRCRAFVDSLNEDNINQINYNEDQNDEIMLERIHERKSQKKRNITNKSDLVIKGFTPQEVRRLVKSLKKFPCPVSRIDTVAQDSKLEDKSQASLLKFVNSLKQLCKQCASSSNGHNEISETNQFNEIAQPNENTKKGQNEVSIIVNGVKIFVQPIIDTEKYFEPLVHFFSTKETLFKFEIKLKQPYWDCEWNDGDDCSLLKGIYEYGYGNWEWIKADPQLGLTKKILINEQSSSSSNNYSTTKVHNEKNLDLKSKLKPQAKHLQTRVDYLMKVLSKQMNVEKPGSNDEQNSKHNRKLHEDINDNIVMRDNDVSSDIISYPKTFKTKLNSKETLEFITSQNIVLPHKKIIKRPLTTGAVHHNRHGELIDSDQSTSMDPNDIVDININAIELSSIDYKKHQKEILSEEIFLECKSLMKPVKKALKNINIDESSSIKMSEKEKMEKIKRPLLEIGDKINDHLASYTDPDKIKEWRKYLWIFVSKFTLILNPERLKNLYNKLSKSRDEEELNKSSSQYSSKNNSSFHSTSLKTSPPANNRNDDKRKSQTVSSYLDIPNIRHHGLISTADSRDKDWSHNKKQNIGKEHFRSLSRNDSLSNYQYNQFTTENISSHEDSTHQFQTQDFQNSSLFSRTMNSNSNHHETQHNDSKNKSFNINNQYRFRPN